MADWGAFAVYSGSQSPLIVLAYLAVAVRICLSHE